MFFLASGGVAPQSQITADMLLRRALPDAKNPAPSRHLYLFTERAGLPGSQCADAGQDAGNHGIGDKADKKGHKKDDGGLDEGGETADF